MKKHAEQCQAIADSGKQYKKCQTINNNWDPCLYSLSVDGFAESVKRLEM